MIDTTADIKQSSMHERLRNLSSEFHQLQGEILREAGTGQGDKLQQIATRLISLCDERIEQVLGELFLSEHSQYNFSKPLYIAASLIELIRRFRYYTSAVTIDDDKRQHLILAALGYNLGLLAYEKKVYESQEEFSPEEKKQLRAHYPQQSGDLLKATGLDHPLIQDVVRNHNVASDNPSKDALLMRTPFIYTGIAMPQNLAKAQQSIENPSREFAQMFATRKLDPVYGGLFLKINGLAPIGSILKFESNEKALVLCGPQDADIQSSMLRMLANRNGVQLRHPGECYRLDKTPARYRGLADHHRFAWTNFSPHVMWEN